MATGSYEGSLPMEGIPDLTSRSLSRANGHGGLGCSFETSNVGEGYTEVAKERRQGCQRLDRTRAPWEETPTLTSASPMRGIECPPDPPKRLGRRENARFPGQVARTPKSARRPRGESRGRLPGTCEVRVHAVRSGGRGRSDASRVLFAGRSQGLVADTGR
jgi:hypothetical protein